MKNFRTAFAGLSLAILLLLTPGAVFAQDANSPHKGVQQHGKAGQTITIAGPDEHQQQQVLPGPVIVPDQANPLILPQQAQPAVTPAQLEWLYKQVWQEISQSYHNADNLTDWHIWRNKYDGKLKTLDDLDKAIAEMVNSLDDRWTRYTSAKEIAAQRAQAQSGVVSLGISLELQPDGTFVIEYVRWGSPADKADLRRGDPVVSIDGKKLKGLSREEADKLLTGADGSKLTVVHTVDGKDKPVDITLAAMPAAQVEARLLPGNIAYVRLPSFASSFYVSQFLQALDNLNKQASGKLEGIVFDLRGNSGGQFQLALVVASAFMEKGTVVTSTTRSGRMITHQSYEVIPLQPHMYAGQPDDFAEFNKMLQTAPLVVLTDGNSASASEIVTGALKDNGRATIIGTSTYGKSVGYRTMQLPNGGVLSVTSLDYLTPSGFNLSRKGITPNVVVEQPRNSPVDEQLNQGVKQVKSQRHSPAKKTNKSSSSSSPDSPTGSLLIPLLIVFALVALLALRARRRNK